MKIRLITASFLLTVMWSYCQETYPQKIVIEGDTVVCINKEQVVRINEIFDELDFHKNKNELLYIDLVVQKDLVDRYEYLNSVIVTKNTEILIENDNLHRKDQINTDIIELYKKDLKHQKNKGIKLMIGGFTVGVSLGVILTLLLAK